MISSRRPELLDLVAALRSLPGTEAEVGDVGTVVELLPPDGIEVEFLDRDGRTRCLVTMSIEDVLTLNRKRTPID